jgi:hypothetical protein
MAVLLSAVPALAQHTPPSWWKGNLHTHSLWSDGNDFPESIVGWYADRGYHFLALSDHNVLSRGVQWMPIDEVEERSRGFAMDKYMSRFGESWVETRTNPEGVREVRLKPIGEYRTLFERAGEFMLLEAEEITGYAGDGRAIHINATNLVSLIEPADAGTVKEVLAATLSAAEHQRRTHGRPVLLHVNHPNYKWGVTAEDLAEVLELQFFEIWNGVDGDNDPGDGYRPSTETIWDIASTLRIAGLDSPPLLGLATDDSHTYHLQSPRAFPGRAWVMVRSELLTPESIIGAMERGDFYSSSGVELRDVSFDGRALALEIQPVEGESYTTRFIGSRRGVSLEGRYRTDENGEILETTLDYTTPDGPQIGEVFAEVDGLRPRYELSGDELFVRAVVTSTGVPEFPSRESTNKKAWTQPVGWRGWIEDVPRPWSSVADGVVADE